MMPAGRMISWSGAAASIRVCGSSSCESRPRHGRARGPARVPGSTTVGRGGLGDLCWEFSGRGRVYQGGIRLGQTQPPTRLCKRPGRRLRHASTGGFLACGGPGRGRGPHHLYCRTCDQKTRTWVSLRDCRDARTDTHHFFCHPDLRRPAVPDPPAVDGNDAGTRSVRPRRQADASVRHLQARRHRGLHAARRLGPRRPADPVHQARHRCRRRQDRDP